MTKLVLRAGLVGGLVWYSRFFLTATMLQLGDSPGAIHFVNLVFHEAGHVLLCWAPRFFYVLGGTLGQLIMPFAVAVEFLYKNRDRFGASIFLWWFGQSLVDVAPYANDARSSRLMLLGGATGTDIEGHDWMYMLGELNVLNYDVCIARVFLATGRIVMVAAIVGATVFMVYDFLAPKYLAKRRQRMSL